MYVLSQATREFVVTTEEERLITERDVLHERATKLQTEMEAAYNAAIKLTEDHQGLFSIVDDGRNRITNEHGDVIREFRRR